ncbi:MAG TPA: STT3 domain-containing protein, partial [Candidatus Nanoarchaeia archaeon]|nr:STT3 domain-containing protein [Candidatus Nanoarchaeia archaeon]
MDEEPQKGEQPSLKEYWSKAKHYASRGGLFVKKHSLLLTLLLVLLLQILPSPGGAYPWGGLWIRAQSENLLFADQAAASTVSNFVRQQAGEVVAQQYPNLPSANREKLISDVITKILTERKEEFESQKQRIAQEVRSEFQYEENGTNYAYMPDIDPYHYLRYARNIEEKGHIYDVLKDGQNWDDKMSAPFGTSVEGTWHPYILVAIHKVMSLFGSLPLMQAAGYHGIVLILLSVVFIFLLARRVAGNLGG